MLRSISVYRHAVVNTPVARWALIARGTAYSNRFPVPSGCGLPHIPARSATTLDFSRPAQRSLAITACRLAESPKRPVCLEGSDGFVSSPRRFDSYRLERPSCRVGISPTEDQHLLHGAQVWCPRNSEQRRKPSWRKAVGERGAVGSPTSDQAVWGSSPDIPEWRTVIAVNDRGGPWPGMTVETANLENRSASGPETVRICSVTLAPPTPTWLSPAGRVSPNGREPSPQPPRPLLEGARRPGEGSGPKRLARMKRPWPRPPLT